MEGAEQQPGRGVLQPHIGAPRQPWQGTGGARSGANMAAMKVSVILPAQEVSGQVVDGGQREGGRGVHLVQQQGIRIER